MKLFRLFFIISFVISSLIILFILFFFPKYEKKTSSNKEIIREYSNFGGDSLFLNQIAEAFIETNYDGVITYNCHSPGSGLHTLGDYNSSVDLTNRFPKIREIIREKFQNAKDSWYDYEYNNGIVFIDVAYSLYNHKMKSVLLLYTNNFKELKLRFSNYKFYDTNTMPIETYGWLYSIGNNWYICSPDDDILFQRYNDFSKTKNNYINEN